MLAALAAEHATRCQARLVWHRSESRNIVLIFSLVSRWVPTCATVLKTLKNCWIHLVPTKENDSPQIIQSFFSCVSSVMSIQLRSMVLESLKDFLNFFRRYEVKSIIFPLFAFLFFISILLFNLKNLFPIILIKSYFFSLVIIS